MDPISAAMREVISYSVALRATQDAETAMQLMSGPWLADDASGLTQILRFLSLEGRDGCAIHHAGQHDLWSRRPGLRHAGVSVKSACLEAAIGVCDRARDLPLALRPSTREVSVWAVL